MLQALAGTGRLPGLSYCSLINFTLNFFSDFLLLLLLIIYFYLGSARRVRLKAASDRP